MGIFDGLYVRETQDGYSVQMQEKSNRYEAYLTKAKTINRDNGGNETKEEAFCYRKAADVCEEIKNLNVSQPAEFNRWDRNMHECMDKVEMIRRKLDPNYVQPTKSSSFDFGAMNSFGDTTPYSSRTVQRKPRSSPVQDKKPPEQVQKTAAVPPADTVSNQASNTTDKSKDNIKISYACKDIPEDMVRSWFKPMPDHDFSDVTGMEEEKKRLSETLDNIMLKETVKFMNYKQKTCFLFYGLPGCGKTFVVEGFVAELMKKDFNFIKLMGSEVHQGIVGAAEKIIKIAFQEALENAPCVLFFDEFELVCADRSSPNVASHEKRLTGSFLEARNLIANHGGEVILMAATNYPNEVDQAMLDGLNAACVPLPDPQSRVNYLKRQFRNVLFSDEPDYDYMAEATENFSYRDLEKVVNILFSGLITEAKKMYFKKTGKTSIDKESDLIIKPMIESGEIKLSMAIFDDVIKNYTPSVKLPNLEQLERFEENLAAAQSD